MQRYEVLRPRTFAFLAVLAGPPVGGITGMAFMHLLAVGKLGAWDHLPSFLALAVLSGYALGLVPAVLAFCLIFVPRKGTWMWWQPFCVAIGTALVMSLLFRFIPVSSSVPAAIVSSTVVWATARRLGAVVPAQAEATT